MRNRYLLLVAPIVALGFGEHAKAAVVDPWTSAVLVFDLPDIQPEFDSWNSQDLYIGCNLDPCASVLYWPLDPPWYLEEDEFERVAPPIKIVAKIGTGPDLDDLGTFRGNGWDYAADRGVGLQLEDGIETSALIRTLYLTFMLIGDESTPIDNAFYVIDYATLYLSWGMEDDRGFAIVTGRHYEPEAQVPVSQVPLPGSLLFVLSSIAAASGISLRKGRASLS